MNLYFYCERTADGIWQEPVNTISNIGFLFAACAVARLARTLSIALREIALPLLLLFAIFLGSTIFHLLGTRSAALFDILPILFFQITYLWLYVERVAGKSRTWSGAAVLIFVVLGAFSSTQPELLNRSASYFPACILLVALAWYHYAAEKLARGSLAIAAVLFFISFCFRIADASICSQFATGTHFLWHLGNGLVLYFTMRALLCNWNSRKLST